MNSSGNISGIMEKLKSKGHKNTKVRQALVEILLSTDSPLSITELLENLSKQKLKPNKTTVYREIDFLKNMEILQEVEFGDGKKRYEILAEHHHHIVCVNCKRVTDVQMDQDLDLFNAKIAKVAGYKPVGHSLEFFGLCKNCQ